MKLVKSAAYVSPGDNEVLVSDGSTLYTSDGRDIGPAIPDDLILLWKPGDQIERWGDPDEDVYSLEVIPSEHQETWWGNPGESSVPLSEVMESMAPVTSRDLYQAADSLCEASYELSSAYDIPHDNPQWERLHDVEDGLRRLAHTRST